MTNETIFSLKLLEFLIYATIFLLRNFFSVFGVDIWRIARTTSTCNKFRTVLKLFLTEIRTRMAILPFYKKDFLNSFGLYFEVFDDTPIKFINSLFD